MNSLNAIRKQEGKVALRHTHFLDKVKEVLGEDAPKFRSIYLDANNLLGEGALKFKGTYLDANNLPAECY